MRLLFCFLLISCGVDQPPLPPEGSTIPSLPSLRLNPKFERPKVKNEKTDLEGKENEEKKSGEPKKDEEQE